MSSCDGSKGENSSAATVDADKELDDLLNDALGDFEKVSLQEKKSESAESDTDAVPNIDLSEFSAEDLLTDPVFDHLYDSLFKMVSEKPKKEGTKGKKSTQEDAAETLKKALDSMNQNLEGLQMNSEKDMMDMFSKMGMDGVIGGDDGDDDEANIMPLVQNMMSNLLSKDILYPSLNEISLKYPQWLSENKGKIEEKEFDKYTSQYKLMRSIVDEYKSERPSDDDRVKQARFDRILDFMQELQKMGTPPKELVSNTIEEFPFDVKDLPKMPGLNPDPNQCLIT